MLSGAQRRPWCRPSALGRREAFCSYRNSSFLCDGPRSGDLFQELPNGGRLGDDVRRSVGLKLEVQGTGAAAVEHPLLQRIVPAVGVIILIEIEDHAIHLPLGDKSEKYRILRGLRVAPGTGRISLVLKS